MTDLQIELQSSMLGANPALAFRAYVEARLLQFGDRTALIDQLERLRCDLTEREEDVVLEVLDFLHGWCRPEFKL